MTPIFRRRLRWICLGSAVAFALFFWFERDALRRAALAVVTRGIRREFPDVRRVSTAGLARELSASLGVVLLDGREPAEFLVSHLPGARSFPPGTDPARTLADLPKDAPVVVYCSVGYRSSFAARALTAAGFRDVRNLEGSIFQWANEDRPLVRGESAADGGGNALALPASRVHPYNPRWGPLLRPERRADVDALNPSR